MKLRDGMSNEIAANGGPETRSKKWLKAAGDEVPKIQTVARQSHQTQRV